MSNMIGKKLLEDRLETLLFADIKKLHADHGQPMIKQVIPGKTYSVRLYVPYYWKHPNMLQKYVRTSNMWNWTRPDISAYKTKLWEHNVFLKRNIWPKVITQMFIGVAGNSHTEVKLGKLGLSFPF